MHRVRRERRAPLERIEEAEQAIASLWRRCEIWEITAAVCRLAADVVPATALRTLDALHLATFLLARNRIKGVGLLTVDARLQTALTDELARLGL